jgi:hypothetical protein
MLREIIERDSKISDNDKNDLKKELTIGKYNIFYQHSVAQVVDNLVP